jgi:glycosyltransferase involved in cell wall biosynthesis
VIVDSSTTDKTVEVAKSFKAKVYIENWKGYGKQKQSALEKTKGDWILFLDADEVVTERLKREILEILKNPTADGYYLKRKTIYLGKPLKFIWNNDWVLRLVKRSSNPYWIGNIHERLVINGVTKKLQKGHLLLYTYRNLKEHFEKSLKYAYLSAEDYAKKGKKVSMFKIFFAPFWAFFKIYFLKLGILEGFRGFLIAISYASNAFMKYAFLWEKNYKKRQEDY